MVRSVTDPWSISQRMIDAMNEQAMMEARFGNTALMNAMGAQATRQNAQIAHGYDVQDAATRYENMKNLDVLGSNLKIREEQFKSGGGSRRPGFNGGATSSNTPMPNAAGGGFNSQAYSYYRSKGLGHSHAAGIVGNLAIESGGDPRVLSGVRRGDQGTAAYAAQWRGPRLAGLEAFARSRGNAKPTLQDQLDYVLEEGNPQSPYYEAGAGRAHQLASAARSPDEAASLFMTHYERPNADPNINHLSKRQQIALSLADAGASPDATATASVEQSAIPASTQASATPFPTGQRRYLHPTTGDVDIDAYAPELDTDIASAPNPGGYSMTPEEVDALIDDTTRAMIPPHKIAVDMGTYSAEQLRLVEGSVGTENLIPLYGTDPVSGKSQYLILADNPNYQPTDATGGAVAYAPNKTTTAPNPQIKPPPAPAQMPFDPASTRRRYQNG